MMKMLIVLIKGQYQNITYVKTVTLDKIIDTLKSNIKLIKLETEGAELEALNGLINNIHKVEYITIDCGKERGILKEETFQPCDQFMKKNNFKLLNFRSNRTIAIYKNILF